MSGFLKYVASLTWVDTNTLASEFNVTLKTKDKTLIEIG
jgi:hypothetical protein